MPDPTEPVIIATFAAALGLFTMASVVGKCLGKTTVFEPERPADSRPNPDSPYHAPGFSEPSPPLPVGRVPTWFYNRLDLLGLGLVFNVFFLLVLGSIRMASEKELVLDPAGLLVSIGFQFVSAGIVTAMVISRIRPIEWLGLKWPGWPRVFLIAPGTVLVMWLFFGGLQISGFMEWMESLGVEAVQDTVKLLQESKDPLVLGLMAFAAVIAAPVCEEIVFRGYFYAASKKFAGPWMAGICSALVFAAAHGSMAALLPLFVFGCVLAFIYEKTGSLWAPVAVHFCFNGATVIVQMGARFYGFPLDATP